MENNNTTQPIATQATQPPVVASVPIPPTTPTTEIPKQPQTPYDVLDDDQKLAVRRRLTGVAYKTIADEITATGRKISESTVEHWFSTGERGKCVEAYEYVRKTLAAAREQGLEEDKDYLFDGRREAIGVLRQALIDTTVSDNQIKSAESILNRTGFPATSKIEGKQEVSVEASKAFTDSIVAIAESLKK